MYGSIHFPGAHVVDLHGTPPGWEYRRFLNLYTVRNP